MHLRMYLGTMGLILLAFLELRGARDFSKNLASAKMRMAFLIVQVASALWKADSEFLG